MAKVIKAPELYRDMQLDRAGIKEDARTIELSFSSELPGQQFFGTEILDHNPTSVRMQRLKNGAPLLVNHDKNDQVGVIERAEISPDRRGRAVVRFGKSARAEEIWNDVIGGIRSLVSCGYRIHKATPESSGKSGDTYRATDWEPFEISIVAVPTDPTVGVGRGADTNQNEILIEETMNTRSLKLDADPPAGGGGAPAPSRVEIQRELQAANVARMNEIEAIAKHVGSDECKAMAREAFVKGTSVEDFRKEVVERCLKAKPITTPDNAEVGMTKREVKQYRLTRALACYANKQPLDGIEKEASDAVAKNIGRRADGFFIPTDITHARFDESHELTKRDLANLMLEVMQQRALTSNVFSAGGALVGTDLLTGSMIELLRNQMFVMAMGARSLSGLVGDVAIPKQTGGATVYWLAQGVAGTRSQQTVQQLSLTPKRLFAATAYDKQLLAQASLSVEAFVREDLMTVLAIEKDRAAINGSASGVAGEPRGILNQPSGTLSTPVTFATAAAPLFTEIIKFETNLATNNADRGNLGYLVHPSVRGHAKGFPKFASTGTPIWENDMMNGYPAKATNQVPSATSVIFGKWSDLIVADWDGIDTVVDPYSLSLNGQISVVLQTLTDIGIRNGKSFAVATN